MWMKIGLLAVIALTSLFILKSILRKAFNIADEQQSFFSYDYVNDLHRKVGKIFKGFSIAALIIALFIFLVYFDEFAGWFLIALFISILLESLIRVFFEYKYSANTRQFVLTLADITILLSVVIIVLRLGLLF